VITENLDLNSAMLDSRVSVITENLDLNSAMLDSVPSGIQPQEVCAYLESSYTNVSFRCCSIKCCCCIKLLLWVSLL